MLHRYDTVMKWRIHQCPRRTTGQCSPIRKCKQNLGSLWMAYIWLRCGTCWVRMDPIPRRSYDQCMVGRIRIDSHGPDQCMNLHGDMVSRHNRQH